MRALVDNFRKRQRSDPAITLRELWAEIGRRFGSTAVITNSLLERLQQSAKFNARDKTKLRRGHAEAVPTEEPVESLDTPPAATTESRESNLTKVW